jgi:hypothetical protein
MVTNTTSQILPEGFPESLPPVHYFLQELNTPAWIAVFRIAAVVVVCVAALIIIAYSRKYSVVDKSKGN